MDTKKNIYDHEYELGLNYVSTYEKIFEKIKHKKLNILEIGVAGGHSMQVGINIFKILKFME